MEHDVFGFPINLLPLGEWRAPDPSSGPNPGSRPTTRPVPRAGRDPEPGHAGLDETRAALTAHMEATAWHRENLTAHEAPELELRHD